MNAVLEQINSTGKAFVEFAVPMLVQSSALIVILLLVDFVLRKKVKAVFRYCIWMLVLVKLVLPTSLSSPLSLGYWFGDKLAYVAESRTAAAPEAEVVEPALADMLHIIEPVPIEVERLAPAVLPMMPDVEPAAAEAVSPPEVSVTPVTWQGVVFLLWLAVVIALGLLLLQRAMFVRGLVAQAKEANALMNDALEYCCKCMGVKRKVGLKVSANAASPAVCGLFRPVILLPHKLAPSLGSRGLRAVLLHELAHIRRGDLWVNLAQTVLQIMYFYNPLLWLANAMIRRVREQAIDETVLVAMGEKAQQYPQTLVNVAKLAFKRPALSLRLIGVVESKSALAGRIKHILSRPMPKSAKVGILGLLAVIIAAAILLPMARAEKAEFAGEGGPLDIRLAGVRPDGSDDIYDGNGNKIAENTFANIATRWGKDSQHRTFIFELPKTEEPILFLPFLQIKPTGGKHGFGTVQHPLLYYSEDKLTYSVGMHFPRTYKKSFLGFFTRDKKIHEIDLFLRYYYGPRGAADFVFTGPFTEGKTVRANGGGDCELTAKEDRLNYVNKPAAFFKVSSNIRFDGDSTLVYDTSGRRHLPEAEGGHIGSDGSLHNYRVEGLTLNSIAYVTVGEKPYEMTFNNVVVSYPDRPARDRVEFLDEMCERLDLTGLSGEQLYEYRFENPTDAIKVIDIVRGQWYVRKVFDAIRWTQPKIELSSLDEQTQEEIRSAAAKWAKAGHPNIRAMGIRLGLMGGWPEFLDQALEWLEQDATVYGMVGPYRDLEEGAKGEIAGEVARYPAGLNSEQAERIKRIILRTDNPHMRVRLYQLFWRADKDLTFQTCRDLVQDDRPWIWWPAMRSLSNRCTEKLRPFENLPEKMQKRKILVHQAGGGSSRLFTVSSSGKDYDTVAKEAYSMLPAMFTANLARMDSSVCHGVRTVMVKHLDRELATRVMTDFLREISAEPMQWLWAGDSYYFNTCCVTAYYIARHINSLYDVNIANLGKYETPENSNAIPHNIFQLKQLIADIIAGAILLPMAKAEKTDVQVEVGFEVGFEFGPVTEVVATRSDTKPNIFIDIDTGKTYEPAEVWVVGARREKMAWVKEKGIDVAVTIHEGDMCLVGNVESVLRRSFDTDWDKTTAAEVLSNRELLKDKFGFDNIQRFRRQLPATFMFKTRQGGMGLFQIVGFTDDPYGVKVRFKMARRASNRQADVQVEGERPREESQVVWGKAIHGVQVGATVAKRKWRIGGDVLRVNVEVRISDQKKYQESGLNTKMIGHFPFKFEIDGGIPVGDRTRYTTIRTGLLAPLRDSFKTVLYLDDYVWQGIEPSFLNPGRHKIRIYFVGLGPSISSGSVEIEMLPKEKKKLESWPHPWGKAVFGVQVSAYPVKPVWQVGSEPVIRIRLRNQDLLNLPIHLWPNSFALEVDGKRYENNFIFHAWPRPFAPGTEYEYDLKLSKSRPFHDGLRKGNSWPPVGKSPPLLPGKHTVRVLFTEWNMQSEPASNPVEIEIVPAEEKPDVQVEVPWGEAVEGVQMRVRLERLTWYEGETPKFIVDMRNKGMVELELVLAQGSWEVELDGLWYRGGIGVTGRSPTLLLGPGEEQNDILFYPGVWSRWNINGKPLKFTPGWHTVRLSFGPSTRDRAYWRRLRLVSNPVVIEVLPAEADKREWGEAVAGLQCGLRADKRLWKADETPRLQAVARNVGRDPWRLPRPSEFFFLKVAGKIWRWKGPGPGEPVELKPGEDLDKTTILLSEDWVPPYDSDLRLKLSPGKHIVQLVIIVSVPVPPEAVPVTIPVTKQLRVTIPVTKQLRIESNVVVVEVLPDGEKADTVGGEADAATALQAELYELWRQRDQDLAGAEAFGKKLLEKYKEREEQALIYYQLAEIYAQSGQISPSKTIEYARAGWWYLHDPVKKARLFVYWGDALQLSKGRREAAKIYLRGLEFCLQFALPRDKPERPAVGRYRVDGPPEVVEEYRRKNQLEMAAWKQAKRIEDLIQHRQALTGQVVQLYAQEPDAFDELRELVMKYLHSEEAAEQLIAAARAYRRNQKVAIPVIMRMGPDPKPDADLLWGQAAEGIRVRLRAERGKWAADETPKFKVDVRNDGSHRLLLTSAPDYWGVEVDGVWYRVTIPMLGGAKGMSFGPDKRWYNLELSLDMALGSQNENGGVELAPGRHTVRAALSKGLSEDGGPVSIRAVSNPVEIEILPAESGVKVEGEKPTIRVDVITDKPAVVLDLDTGDKMQLLEDWPEEYDVAWDNDGGGAIFSKRGGSVTILPIYGVKDFEDAVRSPFSKTVELGEGDGYGVFAKDSRYVWVKTSEGNIAVVEIQNYSPARAMLKWQIIKQNPDVPVEVKRSGKSAGNGVLPLKQESEAKTE